MRLITAAAVTCAAALLVSCNSSSSPASSGLPAVPSVSVSLEPPPDCLTLFQAGAVVKTEAAALSLSCTDPKGIVRAIGIQPCRDGTRLGTVSAETGAPVGWFMAPGPYHVTTGPLDEDKEFSKAYSKCHG